MFLFVCLIDWLFIFKERLKIAQFDRSRCISPRTIHMHAHDSPFGSWLKLWCAQIKGTGTWSLTKGTASLPQTAGGSSIGQPSYNDPVAQIPCNRAQTTSAVGWHQKCSCTTKRGAGFKHCQSSWSSRSWFVIPNPLQLQYHILGI